MTSVSAFLELVRFARDKIDRAANRFDIERRADAEARADIEAHELAWREANP